MTDQVLGNRALNRATLDRQLLLRRVSMAPATAVDHLVGLQGQAPDAPYVALWSRLEAFQTDELARLIEARELIRTSLMRCTVHLVSARDGLSFYGAFGPLMKRRWGNPFKSDLQGLDLDPVVEAGRELLAEQPRTRTELGEDLAKRWPGWNPLSMGYAVHFMSPLVQVTPRALWGQRAPARLTTMQAWVGEEPSTEAPLEELVRRYLGAFGPATVRDIQAWCGLSKLREVVDRLELRRYRGEQGAELYDLPDVVLPDPETPAPPRFLPEYDNLLLSHADRTRVIPPGSPQVPLPPGNGGSVGTLLVDGMWQALWKATRSDDTATLTVRPLRPIAPADQEAVAAEGRRLLAFVAPDAGSTDVRFTPPNG